MQFVMVPNFSSCTLIGPVDILLEKFTTVGGIPDGGRWESSGIAQKGKDQAKTLSTAALNHFKTEYSLHMYLVIWDISNLLGIQKKNLG